MCYTLIMKNYYNQVTKFNKLISCVLCFVMINTICFAKSRFNSQKPLRDPGLQNKVIYINLCWQNHRRLTEHRFGTFVFTYSHFLCYIKILFNLYRFCYNLRQNKFLVLMEHFHLFFKLLAFFNYLAHLHSQWGVLLDRKRNRTLMIMNINISSWHRNVFIFMIILM